MELTGLFQEAVAASRNLASKPDNDTLLKLYALFKQATEGDNPNSSPSNAFDFVAKFKHDAWEKLKGLDKAAAMQQYADLVQSLKS